MRINTPKRSRKPRIQSKILSFVLIFQLKPMFIIYMEALPRALLAADLTSALGISLFVCNIFSLLCFLAINYFTIHFYTMRVPCRYVPWAQVENRMFLLKTWFKMFIVFQRLVVDSLP